MSSTRRPDLRRAKLGAGVLAGLRVVDLSRGIPGPSAALHLSEAGAEVIKIEPSCGDSERGSALFSVLNRGKRCVTLDLDAPAGVAKLGRLLASADVLIHDLAPSAAKALGVDDEALAAACPGLVVSAVTAWPAAHPLAEAGAHETLVLAQLGLLDEQPGHRPGPIFVRMPFASWLSGWFCAIGVMARLIARRRDGRGGAAHTSLAQGALAPMTMHWARAEAPSAAFAKGLDKNVPIPLHKGSDGRWVHVHYSPDAAPWMADALTAMGPAEVARQNALWPPSHVAPNFGANKAIIATRPAGDWVEHFWAHDVSAQTAEPFGRIYFDEQARVIGAVVEVDDPVLGPTLQPGPAYQVAPPARARGAVRAIGADNEAVFASLDRPPSPFVPSAEHPARPPLDGLKVLDLGAYLAGPFAAMLLADLGADVVEVEPPGGDAMRRLERTFAGAQRGKRGVALKLGDSRSQDALDALVRSADVVHHNVRIRAAKKLGIDYERLAGMNPDLIYCHVSSYGPIGPRADWPGFDQLFQASCGWEIENAGEGNPPMWLRFGVTDHMAAAASVYVTLLAVYHRGEGGGGQMTTASLLGAALLTQAEAVAFPDGAVSAIAKLNGDQTGVSPEHRLYRCRDLWIAVAALEAHEVAAFRDLAGPDPDGFFRQRAAADSLARLKAAGVPCAPVLEDQIDAFLDDPGAEAAGLHARYRHARYGMMEQVGGFWSFGNLPLKLDRPPPALGEHTREVLLEHGLTPSDIDALIVSGLAVAA
jgi:crotonobetainyl-CoA:carnitine CoA-transferase CaiB-like acyl-CoA transferase